MKSTFFCSTIRHIKNKLLESHPEICFARLAGRTLLTKKNMPEGQNERIAQLKLHVSITLEEVMTMAKQYHCAIDDILDAACLAVSARFSADGGYATLPEHPEKDDTGLLMQMSMPIVQDSNGGS